jgi:hypothetical protein
VAVAGSVPTVATAAVASEGQTSEQISGTATGMAPPLVPPASAPAE